ncbi:DUF2267 domain-containing protein [Nitrosophilus kaiyonis]|uniref:DUF2267 domain-containing protein n=1 Tax=Nitrosophilus kaiyonis TaxID=2930200 RepID=UPI0024925B5E|nr:DUF2267 domain-containing protein [Nitrosophilus kaiyonis]
MNFEKDVQKAHEFLKELSQEIGCAGDERRAGRVLRAVLRVLRRRVSPEEYMDFIAQLPMCIKAMAVDGWKLSSFPDKNIKSAEDFIKAVMDEDKRASENDFGDEEQANDIVKKVFHFLKKHISSGEVKDMEAELPKAVKELIENS